MPTYRRPPHCSRDQTDRRIRSALQLCGPAYPVGIDRGSVETDLPAASSYTMTHTTQLSSFSPFLSHSLVVVSLQATRVGPVACVCGFVVVTTGSTAVHSSRLVHGGRLENCAGRSPNPIFPGRFVFRVHFFSVAPRPNAGHGPLIFEIF
jgi:hypothetical protein